MAETTPPVTLTGTAVFHCLCEVGVDSQLETWRQVNPHLRVQSTEYRPFGNPSERTGVALLVDYFDEAAAAARSLYR